MQILVHLVLLSQPLPEDPEATTGERRRSASMSPSKKRKRDSTGKSPSILSVDKLEEHLEMLMDKLAMWQLMGSLDDLDGPSQQATSSTQRSGKGKDKESDDRDWMQIFCEDVVEALYVPRDLCHNNNAETDTQTPASARHSRRTAPSCATKSSPARPSPTTRTRSTSPPRPRRRAPNPCAQHQPPPSARPRNRNRRSPRRTRRRARARCPCRSRRSASASGRAR